MRNLFFTQFLSQNLFLNLPADPKFQTLAETLNRRFLNLCVFMTLCLVSGRLPGWRGRDRDLHKTALGSPLASVSQTQLCIHQLNPAHPHDAPLPPTILHRSPFFNKAKLSQTLFSMTEWQQQIQPISDHPFLKSFLYIFPFATNALLEIFQTLFGAQTKESQT